MEKITNDYNKFLEKIETKRKQLILRILGSLYNGKIGSLNFKDGYIFIPSAYYEAISPLLFKELSQLRLEIIRNLHDISDKMGKENLDILEFLLSKMDYEWTTIPAVKKDIEEIRARCGNILLLMEIEENE